jgi:hypothetical protein
VTETHTTIGPPYSDGPLSSRVVASRLEVIVRDGVVSAPRVVVGGRALAISSSQIFQASRHIS